MIKERTRHENHLSYGGCGGSVFRGSFLRHVRNAVDWMSQVTQALAQSRSHMFMTQFRSSQIYAMNIAYYMPEEKDMPSDQVLSTLVYMNNGTLGRFRGVRHVQAAKHSVH